MQAYRAYLVGAGAASPAVPGVAWIGRHRSTGRRWSWQAGRHRARPSGANPVATRPMVTAAPPGPQHVRVAARRRALPAGLAILLVVMAAATVVSGWSAASGAVAVVGMIAR